MRLLITGGSGFIGRHVAHEAARRGHLVRILSRNSTSVTAGQFETVVHDLRNPLDPKSTLEGVDAVVHCAAAMSGDARTQKADTVEGTRHLLNAMREASVRRLINLSTLALYDFVAIPEGSVVDEMSPICWERRGPYAEAKGGQEKLIRSAAADWHWTILRPGIVFGPERTWFYHLGRQWSAKTWLCVAADSLLPLTYVGNCAAAVLDAVENPGFRQQTLNVIDDALPTHKEYLQALANQVSPRPRILTVPWPVLDRTANVATWINARLARGRLPLPDLLDHTALATRCKPLRYSNQRLKQLGWTPRWNWLEGLRRSV